MNDFVCVQDDPTLVAVAFESHGSLQRTNNVLLRVVHFSVWWWVGWRLDAPLLQ